MLCEVVDECEREEDGEPEDATAAVGRACPGPCGRGFRHGDFLSRFEWVFGADAWVVSM